MSTIDDIRCLKVKTGFSTAELGSLSVAIQQYIYERFFGLYEWVPRSVEHPILV